MFGDTLNERKLATLDKMTESNETSILFTLELNVCTITVIVAKVSHRNEACDTQCLVTKFEKHYHPIRELISNFLEQLECYDFVPVCSSQHVVV